MPKAFRENLKNVFEYYQKLFDFQRFKLPPMFLTKSPYISTNTLKNPSNPLKTRPHLLIFRPKQTKLKSQKSNL